MLQFGDRNVSDEAMAACVSDQQERKDRVTRQNDAKAADLRRALRPGAGLYV